MNITEFFQKADINLGSLSVIIIILLSLIQISPIKINPWSWIGRAIGNAFNRSVVDKIDEKMTGIEDRVSKIEDKVDDIQADLVSLDSKIVKLDSGLRLDEAINYRVRILRFCDELQEGRKHSKDSFDQVMSDITGYTKYCEEHPEFKNHQTEKTVDYIEKTYQERLEKKDWA